MSLAPQSTLPPRRSTPQRAFRILACFLLFGLALATMAPIHSDRPVRCHSRSSAPLALAIVGFFALAYTRRIVIASLLVFS